MPEKLHQCVKQVMAQGHSEQSAYAICQAAMEGKVQPDGVDVDTWKKATECFSLEPEAVKSGARHNKRDRQIIDSWHTRADELKSDMEELGAQLEEIPMGAGKFIDGGNGQESFPVIFGAVKAVGDWTLDVLGVPFGGPNAGKDSHGEWFTSSTKIFEQNYNNPIVAYYHGFDDGGYPQGEPEIIGKVLKIEKKSDGWWYRIILEKSSKYATRVWDAAKKNLARASSGSIQHLARIIKHGHEVPYMLVEKLGHGGEITVWPVAEMTLFDAVKGKAPANSYAIALPAMKSHFERAGLSFPVIDIPDGNAQPQDAATGAKSAAASANGGAVKSQSDITGEFNMTPEELNALLDKRDAEKAAVIAAEIERKQKEQERIDAAVKAELERREADAAKGRRLPIGGQAPYQTKFGELAKYDNLEPADQAFLVGILNSQHNGVPVKRASESATKALAIKCFEDKSTIGEVGRQAMKAAGFPATKSDEVMQQDLTSHGDEWVGVAYSQKLWEQVRAATFVLDKIPAQEVPEGHESIIIPVESTDPTYYKVAEVTDLQSSGRPNYTVTASQLTTAKATLSLSKMGTRIPWSGELGEDSLIPFVAQVRKQAEAAGGEQLEHAIIDGDTATGASTNINDIAGTPAATDLFLLFNGFRKSPLVTTTANSRAGGSLDAEDFKATTMLMGTAGKTGRDKKKVAFIVDPNVYNKALELPEVKTRDVSVAPTFESGELNGLYGYELYTSYNMHFMSSVLKANTSGKVDQDTPANNTTGSILAVRWDHWLFGWRRRWTVETWRLPQADYNEIVVMARVGLIQRDTEASAITYGLSV